MNDINIRIFEEFFIAGVALFYPKSIADLIEFAFGSLADRIHIGGRVLLVNGDKFGTEAQAYDCDVPLFLFHVF